MHRSTFIPTEELQQSHATPKNSQTGVFLPYILLTTFSQKGNPYEILKSFILKIPFASHTRSLRDKKNVQTCKTPLNIFISYENFREAIS